MKKLMLALASACAIGLSAVAAESTTTWFDAKVSSYTTWPTNNVTEFGGTWSNTDAATLTNNSENAMLSIHSDADCELSFTATKTQDVSKVTSATIDTNFAFTPYNSNHLPEIPSDAKAGMIVVTTKEVEDLVAGDKCDIYCIGIDKGSDPKTNTWVKTDYTVEMSDAQYSGLQEIKVVTSKNAANKLTVVYQIGSSQNSYTTTVAVEDTEISTVVCRGTGKMSALSGSYKVGEIEFTLANPANASVTQVMSGETELTEPYKVVPGTTVTVTYTADDGYLFSNGTNTMDANITVNAEGEQPAPEGTETTEAKAMIGKGKSAIYYLTLQEAINAAGTGKGDYVTLLASTELTSTITIDKAITLDLGERGVSCASTCATAFKVTSTVTIDNGNVSGPLNGADFDGKAVIDIDGENAELTLLNVYIYATGSGSDGMYGVYVLNGGTLIAGDGNCPDLAIDAHFAAIGANNTTSPTTITINDGTYTSYATTDSEWWYYFCAAIYAPGNGTLTINGGNFYGGRYSIASRYANVAQTITIKDGSFEDDDGNQYPIFVDDQTGTNTGVEVSRVITKSEDVELEVSSDSANYEWGEAVEGYQTLQKKAVEMSTLVFTAPNGTTTFEYEGEEGTTFANQEALHESANGENCQKVGRWYNRTWYANAELSGDPIDLDNLTYADATYYAGATTITYRVGTEYAGNVAVLIDYEEATSYTVKSGVAGANVTVEDDPGEDPTGAGRTFLGWTCEYFNITTPTKLADMDALSMPESFDTWDDVGDIIFVANWDEAPQEDVSMYFYDHGYDSGFEEDHLIYTEKGVEGAAWTQDALLEAANDPEYQPIGKWFDGTWLNTDFEPVELPGVIVKDAKFVMSVTNITYYIHQDFDGGEGDDDPAYEIDEDASQLIPLTEPTKSGATFKAWEVVGELPEGITLDGATITIDANAIGDVNVKATWEASAEPINPGQQKELDVDPSDPEAATKAQAEADKLTIEISDPAAAAAGQKDVVHAVAVYNEAEGKYFAEVQINTSAAAYVAPEEAMPTIATKLAEAAAASGVTEVTLSSENFTPGLYYTVYGSAELDFADQVDGGSTLATGSSITLKIPKVTNTTKAFFKVAESMSAVQPN